MGNIGPLEIIIVLVIALIVLGPQRLPDAARSIGRGVREFRTALSSTIGGDDDDDDVRRDRDDEEEQPRLERS